MIRGGSQNYIVGVLWDRAIVLIFWCPFRFFMLCSLLCSLLNIELTFSQCSSFFLKSLKNGFWYFKIVEYFLYYLLSHQLPPMTDKPWNGLARIAAPAAKALPAPAATSGSSKLAVGLLFPGQGSQYAAGQSKELAWDGNNMEQREWSWKLTILGWDYMVHFIPFRRANLCYNMALPENEVYRHISSNVD